MDSPQAAFYDQKYDQWIQDHIIDGFGLVLLVKQCELFDSGVGYKSLNSYQVLSFNINEQRLVHQKGKEGLSDEQICVMLRDMREKESPPRTEQPQRHTMGPLKYIINYHIESTGIRPSQKEHWEKVDTPYDEAGGDGPTTDYPR